MSIFDGYVIEKVALRGHVTESVVSCIQARLAQLREMHADLATLPNMHTEHGAWFISTGVCMCSREG